MKKYNMKSACIPYDIPFFSLFYSFRGDKSAVTAVLLSRSRIFITVLHERLLHIPIRDSAASAPDPEKVS